MLLALFTKIIAKKIKKIIKVNKLVSAAMLINKNTFLKLKGYDDNFFIL